MTIRSLGHIRFAHKLERHAHVYQELRALWTSNFTSEAASLVRKLWRGRLHMLPALFHELEKQRMLSHNVNPRPWDACSPINGKTPKLHWIHLNNSIHQKSHQTLNCCNYFEYWKFFSMIILYHLFRSCLFEPLFGDSDHLSSSAARIFQDQASSCLTNFNFPNITWICIDKDITQ